MLLQLFNVSANIKNRPQTDSIRKPSTSHKPAANKLNNVKRPGARYLFAKTTDGFAK